MAAGVASVVVAAGATTALVLQDDEQPSRPKVTTSTPTPKASDPFGRVAVIEPARLRIPDLGVDADVLPVGTTPEGAQEVPTSLDDTGWWKDGQRPGQPGNAVIVGHTASKDDGVFDNLADVEKGDVVTVDGKGSELDFVVTSEREVKVEAFAAESDRIYRDAGRSGLVLMTCGDWNGQRFETTVIVYAQAKRDR